MFVGIGSNTGLKTLNSGWQVTFDVHFRALISLTGFSCLPKVWGASAASSKRNASVSSATSVTEASASQGEATYPSSWNHRSGNSWDDVNGGVQKVQPPSCFICHIYVSSLGSAFPFLASWSAKARFRPRSHCSPSFISILISSSALTMFPPYLQDDRSPKSGQFSPQRFDGGMKDTSRYPAATSPTRPAGSFVNSSPFSGQQTALHGSSGAAYDPVVDNELALGMRGMAVEDDYTGQGNSYRQANVSQHGQFSVPQIRAPLQVQARSPYSGYPQPEYAAAYYPGAPGSFPYDAYRNGSDPSLYASSPAIGAANSPQAMYHGVGPQALHPHSVADLHNSQSAVFYDYSGSARQPGSQFYYPPHQALMYHAAPSHSPMLSPSVPSSLTDKKRGELQVRLGAALVVGCNLMLLFL
jgi:hypothetical protein